MTNMFMLSPYLLIGALFLGRDAASVVITPQAKSPSQATSTKREDVIKNLFAIPSSDPNFPYVPAPMGFASRPEIYATAAAALENYKQTSTPTKSLNSARDKVEKHHPPVGAGCYSMELLHRDNCHVKYIDISKTGKPLALDCNVEPLEFPVKFYGSSQFTETMYISPYGSASFYDCPSVLLPITNLGTYPNQVLTTLPDQFMLIAPFRAYMESTNNPNSLDPPGLFIRQFPDLGLIIVQWSNFAPTSLMEFGSTSGDMLEPTITFQLQFFADGNIYFLYEKLSCISPAVAAQIGVNYQPIPNSGQVPVAMAAACHYNNYGAINPSVVVHMIPILCPTNTEPPLPITITP